MFAICNAGAEFDDDDDEDFFEAPPFFFCCMSRPKCFFKLAFSTNLPAGLTHRDRFKMFGLVSFSQNIVPVSDMSE